MTPLPSLTALRCLDASARNLSFTRAAREVHLTQGAVSHQILGLEAQLGTALFVRGSGGLQLTAAGRAYWVEVASALRQLERATQDLVTHKGQGGALNLCVASSFATYWLIPRLSGFVAAHPEVTLNLSTRIGPVDFATSPHDAAIEFCEGAAAGLHAEPILALELHAYAAPRLLRSAVAGGTKGRDRTPAQLRRLLGSLVLIRHTTVPQAWPLWLEHAGQLDAVSPQQLAGGPQYDLLSMALNGAIAGLGCALLPQFVAGGAMAVHQLERLSPMGWTADRAYYLRYPKDKTGLAALRKFQDWLKSEAFSAGTSSMTASANTPGTS